MNKSRCGKIEFYRFVFCLCVLYFHVGKYLRGEPRLGGSICFEFFPHGALGVEFFFLTSGFFMASYVFKKISEKEAASLTQAEFSTEWIGFMRRRISKIFPAHVFFFALTFAVYCVVKKLGFTEIIAEAVNNIPSFFLIQMSGINLGNVLHIEWYISCMLLAMGILYPITRRYYYTFTRCVAPLIAILILGYLQKETGSLTGVTVWMGFTYKSVLRAFAELSLGMTAYELQRYLSKRLTETGKPIRLLLTILEVLCFVFSILLIVTTLGKEYEIYSVILFFVMIVIATSDTSYGAGLFNRKLFYLLGSLSYPIYLSQLIAIYILETKLDELNFLQLTYYATVIVAITVVIWMLISSFVREKHDRF